MPLELASGEMLFGQGDEGDAFYIVETGEIEISVHAPDGRKLALDVMSPGEVFGEIALFGGDRTATATAIAKSLIRRVRRADVMAAIRDDPRLALDFIELLCVRLRSVSIRLEERAFLPLSDRLAKCLLRLAEKVGEEDGTVTVSQADLADFVGATREAVAKSLATWRSAGWISLSRGSVRIVNRAALTAIGDKSLD